MSIQLILILSYFYSFIILFSDIMYIIYLKEVTLLMSTTIRDIVRRNFENDKSTLLVTEDGKIYPGIDIVSESSEFIVIYPIRNLTTKQTLIYTKDIKSSKLSI